MERTIKSEIRYSQAEWTPQSRKRSKEDLSDGEITDDEDDEMEQNIRQSSVITTQEMASECDDSKAWQHCKEYQSHTRGNKHATKLLEMESTEDPGSFMCRDDDVGCRRERQSRSPTHPHKRNRYRSPEAYHRHSRGRSREESPRKQGGPRKEPHLPTYNPLPTEMRMDPILDGHSNPSLYCEVCNVQCTSREILDQHLKGKRHLKQLKTRVQNEKVQRLMAGESIKTVETEKTAFIQETIDNYFAVIIGANFVVEYISNVGAHEPRYVCNLCQVKCDPRTILSHLSGTKHRTHYLRDVRSDFYANFNLHWDDRPLQARLLDEYSQRIRNEEGPGRVQQKMEILTVGNLAPEEPSTEETYDPETNFRLQRNAYGNPEQIDERHGRCADDDRSSQSNPEVDDDGDEDLQQYYFGNEATTSNEYWKGNPYYSGYPRPRHPHPAHQHYRPRPVRGGSSGARRYSTDYGEFCRNAQLPGTRAQNPYEPDRIHGRRSDLEVEYSGSATSPTPSVASAANSNRFALNTEIPDTQEGVEKKLQQITDCVSSGFFQSEEQANLAQQLCSALTQALIKYQQNKRGIGAAPAPQNSSNFLPTNFPRAPSNAQPMPGRFPPPASPAFSTVSANSTLPIATVKHSFRVPSSVRPALDHNAVGNSWLPAHLHEQQHQTATISTMPNVPYASASSSFTKAAMTYGEWRRLNEKAQEDMTLFDRLEEFAPSTTASDLLRISTSQIADESFVSVPTRCRDPLGLDEVPTRCRDPLGLEDIPIRSRDPLGLEEVPIRSRDPLGLEDEMLSVKQTFPKGLKTPPTPPLAALTGERSRTPELPEALRKPPPPLAPLLLNLKQELLD